MHFGVLVANEPRARAERVRRLPVLQRRFDALPVDEAVAESYGHLSAAVVAVGRRPAVPATTPRPPFRLLRRHAARRVLGRVPRPPLRGPRPRVARTSPARSLRRGHGRHAVARRDPGVLPPRPHVGQRVRSCSGSVREQDLTSPGRHWRKPRARTGPTGR
ncbi:hypothetical protein MLP_03700 [Microlunatus phosphovorus NM-1]|uniref:Uncharacterized protein n=1 Tax=Microlunatus phosphovorus (strain ATCC 700054 / DSM 10555 / JCM 9379 / NBRC 101784 / NCIMB 13414 / VKM Ac-1990 / NM-1) TaxID=1032480 RepID=F5XJ58_MICPN|nr:hypothetical protein MLP_03700 [Microlunatus phosphovorus NM-1]